MKIEFDLSLEQLASKLDKFWSLSGEKIRLIDIEYNKGKGSPVYTNEGKYSTPISDARIRCLLINI